VLLRQRTSYNAKNAIKMSHFGIIVKVSEILIFFVPMQYDSLHLFVLVPKHLAFCEVCFVD